MTKLDRGLIKNIAGSEAFTSSREFRVSDEDLPRLPFLKNKFGYYAHLLNSIYDMLTNDELYNSEDFKSVCKGLSYFINENVKGFEGRYEIINNSIISFLGQDYTTSKILVEKLSIKEFINNKKFINNKEFIDNEEFVLCLLKKEFNVDNPHLKRFIDYIKTGNDEKYNEIQKSFSDYYETGQSDPEIFFFSLLVKRFFEEIKSINIRSVLSDILDNDLLEKYINHIIKDGCNFFIFYPSQIEAIQKGILDDEGVISLQTPTSSGKTSICELVAYKNKYNNNGRTLFLAPYRALASEIRDNMGKRLKKVGLSVLALYGGSFVDKDDPKDYESVDLLIVTPEKFIALMNYNKNLLNLFNVLICDEGHLLEAEHRGLDYELIISAFNILPTKKRKIIYSSAIIPNIGDIQQWLGGNLEKVVKSNYRASELKFAFLDSVKKKQGKRKKIIGYTLEVNPTKDFPDKYFVNNVLGLNDLEYLNEKTGRKNIYSLERSISKKSSRIALKSLFLGRVAIFTTQKTYLKNIVKELEHQSELLINVNKPKKYIKLETLIKFSLYLEEFVGKDFDMVRLSKKGILYHNGDLLQPIREKIEKIIRDGDCSLLVCTSTLAEGVNLPVDVLILHTVKRYNINTERQEFISKRDIKNIVGRAGRSGFSNKGLVITVNNKEFSKLSEVIKEEMIEPIDSFFKKIVDWIDQTCTVDNITVKELLDNYKNNKFLQNWLNSIDQIILNALEEDLELNEGKIEKVYKQSFAYIKSSEKVRNKIKELFNLRFEKIKQMNEKLSFFIGINISIDIFNLFEEKIDIENYLEILIDNTDSFSDLNVLIELIYKCDLLDNEEINNFELSIDKLKLGTELWMSGASIQNISEKLEIDIDKAMKFVAKFIIFDLNNIIGKLSKYLEQKIYSYYNNDTIILNFLNLNNHLEMGTYSQIHHLLKLMGLNDRISIHHLEELLVSKYDISQETSKQDLKILIKRGYEAIISEMEKLINPLSFEIIKKWIKKL